MMKSEILALYEISRQMKTEEDRIQISSSDLGSSLGISQQSASRYLKKLEKENLIERVVTGRGQLIGITDEGLAILTEMYLNLKKFTGGGRGLELDGKVTTGLGEGAYYVGEYKNKIRDVLGFVPFPGTLNIKLTTCLGNIETCLKDYVTGTIDGFRKGDRTFGDIDFMPVRLRKDKTEENCYLIIPRRTHHRDEIEIISGFNLRKLLDLKEGDDIVVELT